MERHKNEAILHYKTAIDEVSANVTKLSSM